MNKNISLEEAQIMLFAHCPRPTKIDISLIDSLGRVLAEDVFAQENIPPFNHSPYDGYAFCAQDTQMANTTPAILKVVGEVPAGYSSQNRIHPGEAVKILTGAPVPEGADAVVKREEVNITDQNITIFRPFRSGENVILAGAEVTLGELIAPQGTVITPPLMGLMATLGIATVSVFQKPKIAIINTGDELMDISRASAPGKIRNSNCITLQGYIQSIGSEPIAIGTAKDKAEEVAALIEQGLEIADMIITTGGTMDGDYDIIEDAIRLAGAEILYCRIENKPGSSLTAIKNGKLIMSLSGSPNSAMLNFLLLGMPYIKKMAGRLDYQNPKLQVKIKNPFVKSSFRRGFIKGNLCYEDGVTWLETTEKKERALIRSLIGCNTLAEVPKESGPLPAGAMLTAYFIG